MIVSTDLLIGIATGLALSMLKILWAMSRIDIDVRQNSAANRVDVHVAGAATFLQMPRLVDALSSLPEHVHVHLHLHDLRYIDDACFEAIADWERKRTQKNASAHVDWQAAKDRYVAMNRFGRLAQPKSPEPHISAGASH
jgi:MFS superfamily sulfate permease-like transporter